jgi:hypothetical protein
MSSDASPRPTAPRRPLRRSRGYYRVATALWAAGALLGCVALELQQGAVVTLQGFKTQGRAENGARWRLQGESAVIRGAVYELSGVTVDMDLDDGRTARITARGCIYHQGSGLVESKDPVHMESDGATLDGVGFDMLMSERRLRVRDAVKMVIPGAGLGAANATGLVPPVRGLTEAPAAKP